MFYLVAWLTLFSPFILASQQSDCAVVYQAWYQAGGRQPLTTGNCCLMGGVVCSTNGVIAMYFISLFFGVYTTKDG